MRYSRLTVDGPCSCRIKPRFSTSLHGGPGKFGSATSSRLPTCVTRARRYCRDDAQRYRFGVGKLSSDEARRTGRHAASVSLPAATPSSISFFDRYLSNAHIAEDEAAKTVAWVNLKVVLGRGLISCIERRSLQRNAGPSPAN
jgi:hypothetical protein